METQLQTKPYYIFDQLFDSTLVNLLQKEANQLYIHAKENIVKTTEHAERGGMPKRKFKSVGGGDIQNKIYNSIRLSNFLSEYTGMNVIPSGERGTYSYYLQNNDFLDLHRDVDDCDLTLITCIHSNVNNTQSSGALYLYTKRASEKIESIYNDKLWGYETIHLKQGQSIFIKGGIVPHGVNPMSKNDNRIISVLCFKNINSNII